MKQTLASGDRPPLDWEAIDLVVFDVDGTLYAQTRLRLVMLRQLLIDALASRSLDTIRTLRVFRQVREQLGDQPCDDFIAQQYQLTAERCRKSVEEVQQITSDWLEQRPLPFLAACRYPHLPAVFSGLRASGKRIAAFSDYPAVEKLSALGLQASPVVCATDPHIGRLKPDPLGLMLILKQCGVAPDRTLMIGDRFDRDAAAAKRAGVRALIRSGKTHPEFDTFKSFDDLIFEPLLRPGLYRDSEHGFWPG